MNNTSAIRCYPAVEDDKHKFNYTGSSCFITFYSTYVTALVTSNRLWIFLNFYDTILSQTVTYYLACTIMSWYGFLSRRLAKWHHGKYRTTSGQRTQIFWLYSLLFSQVCLGLFLFLKLMLDMKEDNLILMIWIATNNYSSFCGNRLQGISSTQNLSLSLTGSLLAVSVDSKCDNRAQRVDCLHQWSYYCLNWGQWDISHKDCAWVMAIALQPSSTSFFLEELMFMAGKLMFDFVGFKTWRCLQCELWILCSLFVLYTVPTHFSTRVRFTHGHFERSLSGKWLLKLTEYCANWSQLTCMSSWFWCLIVVMYPTLHCFCHGFFICLCTARSWE